MNRPIVPMGPSTVLYVCAMCKKSIPPMTEHMRMTIQMLSGPADIRRYCLDCMMAPELSVVGAHVRLNPVKSIEIFMVYR